MKHFDIKSENIKSYWKETSEKQRKQIKIARLLRYIQIRNVKDEINTSILLEVNMPRRPFEDLKD